MKYWGSLNQKESELYANYLVIVDMLARRGVHISNAKDLARYIRENHLENDFQFTNGFEQFCKDADLGYYEDNTKLSSTDIQGRDLLYLQHGVHSFRELVQLFDEQGLPEGMADDDFLEGSYEKFKQAVEAGYYDYDEEKWVSRPMTKAECLQERFGVSSYRELIARVDREGFTAVYGPGKFDFAEGSYEAFRKAVLEGKYDE